MKKVLKKEISRFIRFNGKNEQGFTLIDTLFALMVTSMTVLLVSVLVQSMSTVHEKNYERNQLDWHIFLNQFEAYLEGTSFEQLSTTALVVNRFNPDKGVMEKDTYEKNVTTFRRRVNSSGHQPMLMDVESLMFTEEGQGVQLDVTFTNKEHYSGWIDLSEQREKTDDE